MARYDSRADLLAKVFESKIALHRAQNQLEAFDWLVAREVGSIKAAELSEWPDAIANSKEFSNEEKAEYAAIFKSASTER